MTRLQKLLASTLLLVVIALPGCRHRLASADDKSKIHVGIVFDIGGKDDRSFNAAAWEGVKRAAKELPIVLRDVEPGDPTSIEPAMRAFAERGYDLIIGVGFAQAPIMETGGQGLSQAQFRHHRRRQSISRTSPRWFSRSTKAPTSWE